MDIVKKLGGVLVVAQLLFTVGIPVTSAGSQEHVNIEEVSSKDNQLKDIASSEVIPADVANVGSAAKESETSREALPENNSSEMGEFTTESLAEETESSTEESQETSESIEDYADKVSTYAIEAQATGSGMAETDPRIVNNSDELVKAIETDRVNYVQLAGAPDTEPDKIFELTASRRIRIYNDLTIDGNGRTVSYAQRKGNNAFEAEVSGIHVKFKNITFGSPDFSVPADDYYGFCQSLSKTNVILEVEDINYYSNYGAQPFYNASAGGQVRFSGINNFVSKAGSLSEEFAQCSQFLFKQDSKTTIQHDTGQVRAIWATNAFSFELEDNAFVDFETTASDFVGLPVAGGTITIGKNAHLKLNGNKKFVYSSNVRNFSFLVKEQAQLEMSVVSPFNINANSTFKIEKDSILDMTVTNDSKIFYNRIPPSNFIVDNAFRMSFEVAKANNSELLYTGMTFNEFMAGVTSYGITADNEAINTVIDNNDTITSNGSDLTISNASTGKTDFTTDEKTAIRNATRLVFQRLPTPASIQNVKKVVNDTKAVFNLSEYLSNGNTLKGVTYQLFESKQDISSLGAGIETVEIEPPLNSEVTFSDLESEKEYWLYVQLKADFSSGDSEWFEVPFKTKSSVLSVSVPTSMFFTTEMDENGKLTIQSPSYTIKNNSAYPIDVAMTSFEEKSESDIELLDEKEPNNSKGLLLQLTKNRELLTNLKTDLTNIPISKLGTDEHNDLRFAGEYFGTGGKEINVKYMMTLNFEKAED